MSAGWTLKLLAFPILAWAWAANAPEQLLVSTSNPKIATINITNPPGKQRTPSQSLHPAQLTNVALDGLIARGNVLLDHPNGGSLRLTLTALKTRAGTEILSVMGQDGEPGTITRRGEYFYATIATRSGTYAISGTQAHVDLVHQEQLNLRQISGSNDYATPPG